MPAFILILLLGLLLAAPADGAATAPEANLRVGHKGQDGGLVWAQWTGETSGSECTGIAVDGFGQYPKPLRLAPGEHKLRFVLSPSIEPSSVTVESAKRPGSSHSHGFHPDLKPKLRNGQIVAWKAIVSMKMVPPRQRYIDLYVEWPPDSCGPPRDLFERFHLAQQH